MAKIFLSFNIVSASDMIMVVRDMDDLLSEVYREVFTAPHSEREVTIDDVNPVMHRVEFWTTVDGTTLLEKRNTTDVDAGLGTGTAFTMISFIVDRGLTGDPNYDPPSDTSVYSNPNLDGATYSVFKAGYGPLIWGVHIDTITGGGFEYIDGQKFAGGEEFTIFFSNLVTTRETESTKSFPKDTVEITASDDIDTSHYNKMLEINGSGAVVRMTITDLNAIPNGTIIGMNTHNGTQRYASIKLPSGKFCMVCGETRNEIYLGQWETAYFIKKADELKIITWDGDYWQVGARVHRDGKVPRNGIAENGAWLLKADYPRLWEWYVADLPAGDFFTDATETDPPASVNKGKWGHGNTKFWLPNRAGYFERNISGSRKSGDIQLESIGAHTHPVKPPDANSATGFGKTTTGNDAGEGTGIATYNTEANVPFDLENRPENMATNNYRII